MSGWCRLVTCIWSHAVFNYMTWFTLWLGCMWGYIMLFGQEYLSPVRLRKFLHKQSF